jgi:sulfate transport system ATP-binding protein
VARFLGAANLFLGRISPDGLQLGSALLAPDSAAMPAAPGTEAVFVVRPEDVELGATDGAAPQQQFAHGTVRSLTFAGHQQHVNIELDPHSKVHPAIGDGRGESDSDGVGVSVDALRSAAEQDAAPLAVGAHVNLGVRRLHALPTPISSFRVIASTAAQAEALEANPLLAQLVRSMQARVIRRVGGESTPERLDAGICVLPLTPGTADAVKSAIALGARRILCLPMHGALPARMLVHARDPQQRGPLLALVSSVMRHLPVEAIAVTLQRSDASRTEVVETQRTMLDTSADLRGAHGLDLRGERFVGDLPAWLARVCAQPEPALVVLGLKSSQPELDAALRGELAVLFGKHSYAPVLFAVDTQP